MIKVKILLVILLSVFSFNTIADEYSDFWDWFQSNESKYYKFDFGDLEKRDELFDQLSSQLLKIDENLTFEFGLLPDERMDFVISAGGIKSSFPSVIALVEKAPVLEKWKFTAFRQKNESTTEIQLGGMSLSAEKVLAQLFRDGDKIGLVLFMPGYQKTGNQIFEQVGFLLLDQTLGEYVVGARVGFVEFQRLEGEVENSFKLSDISPFFE